MSDSENNDTSEDRLQRDLEKQISQFARLFAMLDTDSEGEGAAALIKLRRNMERINELQEKLTGTRGTLNFQSLLEKIENGGGGASSEQIAAYEQVIAEYQAANESLKDAETMLRAELERRQLVDKYARAAKIENIDLGGVAKKALIEMKDALGKLQEILEPHEQAVDGLYNEILDEMVTKDLGGEDRRLRARHRLFSGIMRVMKYPVDVEDAIKLQTLAATQAQMLHDTAELQEKMTALKESIPSLQEAIDIGIYQSGTHPDLNNAIKAMRVAVRQAEEFHERAALLQEQMRVMKDQHDTQMAARQKMYEQQKRMVGWLDTRMLELLNDIDRGHDPLAGIKVPDDKGGDKKKTPSGIDARIPLYRKEALDWTSDEVLRRRLKAVADRAFKIRLGDTLRPVTLEDVLKENHALHAYLARGKKDASVAAREGNKILASYRLVPAGDVDRLTENNKKLREQADQARREKSTALNRVQKYEGDNHLLQQELILTRDELRARGRELVEKERDNKKLQQQIEDMKHKKGPAPAMMMAVGVLAGAFFAAALSLVTNSDHAPASPEAAIPDGMDPVAACVMNKAQDNPVMGRAAFEDLVLDCVATVKPTHKAPAPAHR